MPERPFQPGLRLSQMDVELPCHVCGYDLRTHPEDGRCPECAASVAESRRVAAISLRPAWRDSDVRWRRHMLAGAWVLVLLPLVDALEASGLASRVPVPSLFDRGGISTLDNTFACQPGVYAPLVFCIGVVLLFSKERGRRRTRLDWTRRWGVICSYVVLLLSAAQVLFLTALVLTGIAAIFITMPSKYQPEVTGPLAEVGRAYLRYGPYPSDLSLVVLVAFSSIAILLACVPLFVALRSSGPKWGAATLLAPLVLFSLTHLVQVGSHLLRFNYLTQPNAIALGTYFRPALLVGSDARTMGGIVPFSFGAFGVEAAKWCAVLVIAVWLGVAQFKASPRRRKAGAGAPSGTAPHSGHRSGVARRS